MTDATRATETATGPQTGEGTREASQALLDTIATAGNGNPAGHPIPANAIRHPACGQWWTGLSRSHCPVCCRTFSTDTAANKHRVGKFGPERRCIHPAEVGLVPHEKPYGTLWSLPAPEGGYTAARLGLRDGSDFTVDGEVI